MIEYIKGTLEEIYLDSIIVENNGMAYKIYISAQGLNKLPEKGRRIKIYIHMNIKEDDITLYGFLEMKDREIYRRLISVSGVGPKVGMGILSVFSSNEIIAAIINNNPVVLAKAPGIGKKIAQRIILELKDKLKSEDIPLEEENTKSVHEKGYKQEVVEALISLGYQPNLANRTVNEIYNEGMDIETLLRSALKIISK